MRWLTLCLCASFFTAPVAANAADRIGLVKRVQGAAQIERGGDTLPATLNAPVFENDVLVTGDDAAVGVLFADDTRFAIGPNAETTLDSFIYDPQGGSLDMALSLARGTAAFVTGRIGQFSPESVKVRSPVATIGVRGTRFVVSATEPDGQAVDAETTPEYFQFWPLLANVQTEVVLLPDEDGGVGQVFVEGAGGEVSLSEANEAVRFAAGAVPPVRGDADNPAIAALFGDALDHLPTPAERFAIRFPSGQATLSAQAEAAIARAAEEARRRGSIDLGVIGHTDRAGDAAANEALSQARAEAVRAALVARGVPADQIRIAFHGEREPVVATADGVAEPQNRRVEVVVQ